ncbi:MAG: ATP-dependent Clp protease proteolytic subunit [Chitinophagales bacterium]|nr:ATP-dependent Clp protease proteolytic subunit [Chitinophagales bacterium]
MIFYNEEEKEDKEKEKEDNGLSKKMEETFLKKRRVFLWGVVDDKSMEKAINQVLLLDALDPGKDIELFISSPGGSVTAGLSLLDVMKMISSPVHTICMGLAASMGSMLLSQGVKGKRKIFPNGRVMIHQPSIGGVQGQAIELEITAKQIVKTRRILAEILAENCGQSVEKILKDFDRDYWMDAKEALEYGIVDEIITSI